MDSKTVMLHYKLQMFSEELCRPCTFIGGREELIDSVLVEFGDVLPSFITREDIVVQVSDF